MRNISEILQDIKNIKNFTKETDLAKLFGVKPNVVSTWRARNTIPYKELIALCEQEGWDVSILLSGQGMLTEGKPSAYPPETQRYIDMLVEVLDRGDPESVDIIKGELAKEYRRIKHAPQNKDQKKGA